MVKFMNKCYYNSTKKKSYQILSIAVARYDEWNVIFSTKNYLISQLLKQASLH